MKEKKTAVLIDTKSLKAHPKFDKLIGHLALAYFSNVGIKICFYCGQPITDYGNSIRATVGQVNNFAHPYCFRKCRCS